MGNFLSCTQVDEEDEGSIPDSDGRMAYHRDRSKHLGGERGMEGGEDGLHADDLDMAWDWLQVRSSPPPP